MSRSLSTNCGAVESLNFHPVRLKAVRTPGAQDGTRADIDDLRHHGGGPWVASAGGSVWVSVTTRAVECAKAASCRAGDRHNLSA